MKVLINYTGRRKMWRLVLGKGRVRYVKHFTVCVPCRDTIVRGRAFIVCSGTARIAERVAHIS